jgi:4'-phosphopantetheinyl transferase
MTVNSEKNANLIAAQGPVEIPAPAPGVALYLCGLARSAAEIREMAKTLSVAETARAARFGRSYLRDRYVAGRATLRLLLAAELGLAPAEVPIARGTRGRPHVPNAPRLDFNVSHTRGVALIGIAHGPRIGVDIEHADRVVNVEGVARKFMSAREQDALASLAPDDRRRALLRLWTCKEAMSKATGDALAAPFRRMDVVTDPSLQLKDGPAPYVPYCWQLHAIAVPGGYLATIALWHGASSS